MSGTTKDGVIVQINAHVSDDNKIIVFNKIPTLTLDQFKAEYGEYLVTKYYVTEKGDPATKEQYDAQEKNKDTDEQPDTTNHEAPADDEGTDDDEGEDNIL